MTHEPPPHEVNEVFDLPIEALIIDPRRNMRGLPTDEAVHQMALSLGAMGQLQNVLVVWRGQAYELVVGYTRAIAIHAYGEKIGLRTIRAMRIAAGEENAARLAENFVRQNPSTFETAKFFSELCADRGQAITLRHVAVIVGKSEQYVRGLLRLFRELPPDIKTAWENDRDQRFTFHKLNDLVRLKQAGDEAGLNARLHEILAVPPKRRGTVPKLGYRTGEESLAKALESCGLVQHPNGTVALRPRLREENQKRRTRRLSRRQLETMEARLAAIAPDRLTQFSVGGDMFHRFVRALLGKAPRAEAWSIVDHILAGDGETNASQPTRAGSGEDENLQQRDIAPLSSTKGLLEMLDDDSDPA